MAILHITKKDFEKEIKSSKKTVLLDFYADWCGPCKMIAPIIEEIASEHPEITVCKINVDTESALAIEYQIASIPTIIIMKDGVITGKAIGYRSKEQILEMLL